MAMGEVLVLVGYGGAMLVILLFGLGQMHLAWISWRTPPAAAEHLALPAATTAYPYVTVQLPVYNEVNVVERLLEVVEKMDYPANRWELQVLDDSTDDTTERIAVLLAGLSRPLRRSHLRRRGREGYKTGALTYGLTKASGSLIACFDADFMPPKHFLAHCVPYFIQDPKLGFLQCRWGHLNADENLLTRLLAFGLDAHFEVEQVARQAKGYFTNFNGTAGIWRKTCIEHAGGWQADTLTEDLDLSYRAQLAGWHYRYLRSVSCPAELPANMRAIKQQQRRWVKGGAQCARKHLWQLLRGPYRIGVKVHGALHLLNSTIYCFLFVATILSPCLLYVKAQHESWGAWMDYGSLFMAGFLGFLSMYAVMAARVRPSDPLGYFTRYIFLFLSFSMALVWSNMRACLEGWLGIQTAFRRTPKLGNKKHAKKNYTSKHSILDLSMEIMLTFYFSASLCYGLYLGDYGLVPFHGLLAGGHVAMLWHQLRNP